MVEGSPTAEEIRAALTVIPVPRPDLRNLTWKEAQKAFKAWRKDVKTAYRNLVKLHHPDKVQDEAGRLAATEKLKAVNDAHAVLEQVQLVHRTEKEKARQKAEAAEREAAAAAEAKRRAETYNSWRSRVRWSPPPQAPPPRHTSNVVDFSLALSVARSFPVRSPACPCPGGFGGDPGLQPLGHGGQILGSRYVGGRVIRLW